MTPLGSLFDLTRFTAASKLCCKRRGQVLADTEGLWLHKGAFERAQLVAWASVRRIESYKLDLLTTDQIRLSIFTDGGCVEVDEEQAGWQQIIEEVARVFPSIRRDWLDEVMFPPFATNLTVLYDRDEFTSEASGTNA